MDTAINILIWCPRPECIQLAPQTATFNREDLKAMLEADDVPVFGTICGHDWKLTKHERATTRKRLEQGLL